ncbi:TrkH family potassium uptake protein [Candidatus Micrarchaeota archaeon]|nr:TrkH family potassium uptake protein [Candidatus Micrarchaeota archaeon]
MPSVYNYLKPILLLAGASLLIPTAYGFYLNEPIAWPMLASALLLLLPGAGYTLTSFTQGAKNIWAVVLKERVLSWNFFPRKHEARPEMLSQSDALLLAALAWLLVPLVTALPYFFAGYKIEDGLFESMSGWTATGLSFVQNVEALPRSLIFFRSFTQWIGGVGILLFALLVLRTPVASQLLRAEGRDSISLSITKTVKIIWGIYLGLTLAGVAFLYFSGMPLFDSVNISMVSLATGGFSPTNSLAVNALQKLIITMLMLWGATSFTLHYAFWKREFDKINQNTEFKMMAAGVLFFAVLIVLFAGDSTEDALFHVSSALSGTGLSLSALEKWGDLPKYLLFLLMISGGCSGSTSGAIKIWRTFVMLNTIVARVRSAFLPEGAVQIIRVNQKVLRNEDVMESGAFVFMYLFVIMVSAFLLLMIGQTAMDAFFLTASALGNVGLSSSATWFAFPLLGKAVLFLCMWIGRVEILPALILIRQARHQGGL